MDHAHRDADRAVYDYIDPKSSEIFCLVNQMRRENVDVMGDKSVRNDAGEMSLSEEAKQKAWLEHYKRLCLISLLYLDLYVLGDDALIS